MIRIGCVPYLNAAPLVWTLRDNRVRLEPPGRLAPLLKEGEFDVALLPAIERFRFAGLAHAPDIAIACNGPSETVLLHLARPLADVRRVRLDPNSRSSNALLRILLERKHGLKPEYVEGEADAWLTIGDASFKPADRETLDLGAEWKAWTDLPFVFAVWAYPENHSGAASIVKRLTAAKIEGLAAVDVIAEREAPRVGISFERARRYLTETILYDLGEKEAKGLERFIALCREMKLI